MRPSKVNETSSRPQRLALLQQGTAKPKRNEPCPCGSGRKYKKCCLHRPVEPDTVAGVRFDFLNQV
jgi:hypothetical protein